MARRKSQPTWLIAVGILIVGLFSFLSQLQSKSIDQLNVDTSDPFTIPERDEQTPGNNQAGNQNHAIRIASFNIQFFGQSKLSDKQVTQRLAEIVRRFDVVAIQEIRSKDQLLMPKFVSIVNATGARYDFLISSRLGRTSSKEQYAFLYNTSTIKPIPGSAYMIYDPQDLIHREPFVSSFQTINSKTPDQPFTFTLINIHTDPDEAEWEVAQMAQVYQYVSRNNPQEDDVIVLGDLNVNARKISPLTRIPVLDSILKEVPTNTRKSRQYDHILVNRNTTTEFTGKTGVFDMEMTLGLSREEALKLSDHQPIWAEFSTQEKKAPTKIAQPASDTVIR